MQVPDKPVHEARMIHCSSCGGKLRTRATKCDYCGCEVTLAEHRLGPACPQCFARLTVGAQFCSECGIKIDPQPLRGVRSSAACPRCKGQLVLREFAQGQYTECSNCGGIWLDEKSFERIVEERDGTVMGGFASVSKQAGSHEGAGDATREEKVAYLPCPVCARLMLRKNFAGCSGVIVDWCKGHGFWFDTFELEKVIAFIQSGGMDKSRRMEIDRARRELDRIKEQQKSAAAVGSGWALPGRSTPDLGYDLSDAFSTLLRRFF